MLMRRAKQYKENKMSRSEARFVSNLSLCFNLIHLAVDEGKTEALQQAQNIQQSLETICECGSLNEVKAASFLLANVNQAIKDILSGELVEVAKAAG
jgi:hypothetical protein